jgi:hypothetical protein
MVQDILRVEDGGRNVRLLGLGSEGDSSSRYAEPDADGVTPVLRTIQPF